MAYISDSVLTISTAASSKAAGMPVHVSGDLLVAVISNDTGGTAITVTAGWTQVTTQSANLSQRIAIYYKIAASSSETFTASGANDDWNISMITVKEFDATTPFNGSARYDMPSNAVTCASPSLTTTNNNCLLIYAWSFRVPSAFSVNPGDLINLTKPSHLDASKMQVTGYRQQFTAGAVPSITALTDTSSRGGTSIVLAINDVGNGKLERSIVASTQVLSRYGAFGVTDGVTTQLTANKMSTTAISSLGGVSVSSTAPSQIATDSFAVAPYGVFTRLVFAETAGTGLIVGTWHTISSTDFTDAIFSVNWEYAGMGATTFGSDGLMVAFQDASNNYAVFRLTKNSKLSGTELYVSFIACDKVTPIYSSGTIDWTGITKVIYCMHRTGAADGSRLYIRDGLLTKTTTFVGGNVDRPITPVFLKNVLEGWGQYDIVKYQGTSQVANRSSVQVGDGTRKTYYKAKSTSFEFPVAYDADSLTARFSNTPASSLSYTIYASANDTILFNSCLMASDVKQKFKIHASSSTSATYSFQGLVLSGYEVTGKAGITFNSSTFDQCYNIGLLGGGLSGCTVSNSLDTVAVTTSDPGAIENTHFTSSGTGHAIEASATGTFDFNGNTFTGYAATDGSSGNEAFYNNSGGLITLNIPAGDDIPSVRNGTSASTVISTPTDNQSVTITGAVAGSRIEIYDLTSATQLYNGTPTFPYTWTDSSAYVADREIRLRVAYVSGTSAKEFIEVTIGTATESVPSLAYLVNQVDDAIYNTNGIDGSAVTDITIDDGTMLLSLSASTETWQNMYAYEMYWLFTSTGIEDLGQSIVAPDTANYLIDSSVLTIKNVSGSATTITGGWGRDRTSGDTLDIIDLTGDPIFANPPHVVAFETLGSPVITGDIADVPTAAENAIAVESALSDDFAALPTAAENATAVETALDADLTAILSNTDATQAKIDQL